MVPPDPPGPPASPARAAVLLAALYVLAGLVALAAVGGGAAAPFWPPAGVALGGLIRWGRRAWPGVAAGAAVVELLALRTPWVAAGVVAGLAAGAVVGAWLVGRLGGGRSPVEHHRGAAALILGATAGTLVGAAGGAVMLWAGGRGTAADLPREVLVWWVGDAVAALLVAPAFLVRWRRPAAEAGGWVPLAAGAAAVAGLAAAVAAAPGLPNWLIPLAPCLPAAVWAGTRYGPPGAAAVGLLTAAVLAGLVAADAPGDDRLAVALFAVVVGLTGLCVGAATAERDDAVRAADAGRGRLAALLAHGHDIVGVLGPGGRVAYLNAAAARLTGHPHDWLLGGDPFTHIHRDDAPAVRAALARAAAAPGAPQTVAFRFLKADGAWAAFEAVMTDRAADPAVGGVVVNARDVTARAAAERAAAETKARFRNLFEAAPVAIWEEDLTAVGGWFARLRAAGVGDLRAHLAAHPGELTAAVGMIRVRAVNRAAVEMNAARDAADLIANLPKLFTPSALAAVADILAGLWDGRSRVRADSPAVRLDGTPIDLVLHLAVPERDGRPDLSRVVLITVDVTEAKREDGRRREAAKLDAVGRLAGGIAHDFNNLLTVITGFAEVLAAGLEPASAEADAAGRIAAAADRAAALTRQLLAFGRRHPANPIPLDVAAVLRGLEPALAKLAGPGVRVEVRPADGLPVVRADQSQWERAVLNLATNAAEAMPAGGDLTITAATAEGGVDGDDVPPGNYVVVAVADTGAGIPEAARPHLFEPFFTTKDVGQGPGLGLATVHGIVTQAGGHVRYATGVGGTTFRVYWPVTGTTPPPRTPPGPPPATRRATVLLAEDEPAIRDLSAQVLAANWDVAAAGSGTDALARLADLPAVDVLVTDVVMPGMNGRELADRVKEAAPGVKVVFVSGYTPDEVLPAALGPGEVFLPKPFTPDQLARAVRGLLDP